MTRILVVEDNATNMRLAVLLLQAAGYAVLSASVEARAVRPAAERRPLGLVPSAEPAGSSAARPRPIVPRMTDGPRPATPASLSSSHDIARETLFDGRARRSDSDPSAWSIAFLPGVYHVCLSAAPPAPATRRW